MKITHLVLALAALLPACSRTPTRPPTPAVDPPSAPDSAAVPRNDTPPAVKAAAKDDHVIGAPRTFENLTVFPITAHAQVDVGPITTLDAALQKHDAEVREVGSEHGPAAGADSAPRWRGEQAARGGGARVNTLVIENKGSVPVYVLAGTVVKGGNQDRQIGQDFIIASKQVADVDAFCVEHGRWTGERDGRVTEGKFDTVSQLVTSGVRAAGQYQQNQGEVWAKVADVNAANKKSAASGTLLATLDDGEVAKHRAALASQVIAYLKEVRPANDVVGIAYAVDGRVRGARWFINHSIFDLYRTTLVNTAAVDAITAAGSRDPQKAREPVPVLTPGAVTAFIDEIEAAKVKAARDAAAAANEYRESSRGYGSRTMMKMPAATASPAAAPPAPVPISQDYLVK
jgi:hypothetical protein